MEIRWFKKVKNTKNCCKDVRVAVVNGGKVVSVTFFHGAYEKINKNDNLQVGICGNRIYFRGSEPNVGMKVHYGAETAKACFTIKEFIDFAKKHKAEYDLEYDVENNLYYIADEESNV